jgi:hypothetical protein
MNHQIAHYATLRFQPYPNRSEHLNYGIVVFLPKGGIRIHLTRSLRKLKVLAPSQRLETLREQETTLPALIGDAKLEQALAVLKSLRVLQNIGRHDLGAFSYASSAEYEQNTLLALRAQCDVSGPSRSMREPKSRLYVDVKSRFKALGILATDRDALPDHQVVEHYVPDPEVDVKVEFALQNGLLRVAQTVDLRTDSSDVVSAQNRNIAFSKAYAIHVTRLGLHNVESYVIAAGAETESAKKILSPIAHDADRVFHWEDGQQMQRFFSEWAQAAGRPIPTIPVD